MKKAEKEYNNSIKANPAFADLNSNQENIYSVKNGKHFMQFDEQKALEIIAEYSLAKSTLAVWRNRGAIPAKYENGEVKTRITSENELQQQTNLINAIKTEKINIAALSRLAGLKSHNTLQDAIREKANLSKEDLVAYKKALNTLRTEISKVVADLNKYRNTVPELAIKAIGKLFKRTELQWFVILNRKKSVYDKFDAWLSNKRSFPAEELATLKTAMNNFITETAI